MAGNTARQKAPKQKALRAAVVRAIEMAKQFSTTNLLATERPVRDVNRWQGLPETGL
jgi:hypothetical protein